MTSTQKLLSSFVNKLEYTNKLIPNRENDSTRLKVAKWAIIILTLGSIFIVTLTIDLSKRLFNKLFLKKPTTNELLQPSKPKESSIEPIKKETNFQAFISKINPFALSSETNTRTNEKQTIHTEIGCSNKLIDTIRNICTIPMKVLLGNHKYNSGNISQETIAATEKYLQDNNLYDVEVFVNQYKPQRIWQLIFSNPKTSLISKIFLGIEVGFIETFTFPKLFGSFDHYNPLSNSIHLFSDDTSIALLACADAKNHNSRKNPGLYAFASEIPVIGSIISVSKFHIAYNKTIKYLCQNETTQKVKNAYKVLLPCFGFTIAYYLLAGGQYIIQHTQSSSIAIAILGISAISILAGHIIGRKFANDYSSTTQLAATT